MKYLSLLLLPLLFMNCGKELETLTEIPYTVQFEIPAGLNPFTVWELTIPDIRNEKLIRLAQSNIEEDEIQKIVGKSGLLSAVFSGAEFDFIEEIKIEVFSDDVDDHTEILYREAVSENTGRTLGLNASLPDVSRHMQDDYFGIIITIRARRTAIQNISCNLDFELGVL